MTAYDLLIRGGTVIDPASGLHDRRDVGIADGRIAAVAAGLSTSDVREVVDATDRLVVPGLVDLHVHVDPGVARRLTMSGTTSGRRSKPAMWAKLAPIAPAPMTPSVRRSVTASPSRR